MFGLLEHAGCSKRSVILNDAKTDFQALMTIHLQEGPLRRRYGGLWQ
jgi:hypothetical protein